MLSVGEEFSGIVGFENSLVGDGLAISRRLERDLSMAHTTIMR
jgi:hypothetical protein